MRSISLHLKPSRNTLRVVVRDITAEYGPTGGWEDYGGITRAVSVDIREALFVEDFQWRADCRPDFTASDCALTVWLSNRTGVPVDASLSFDLSRRNVTAYSDGRVVHVDGESQQVCFTFRLDNPELWCPKKPSLYDLKISVQASKRKDEVSRKVGVRDFRTRGSRFLLNGEEVFLKGVARHKMWGDSSGFTLTIGQIERGLTLIKQMGANFVRLVHYPHSRETIEAADRIGLMVSEEPGLWWSDMGNDAVTGKALEIMRRIVLRDRNSPSVIAWLFFNECVLSNAGAYLINGRDLCKELDPTRLVSGANCMESKEAKEVFDRCNFDFYTQHPYSYQPEALEKAIDVLQGKPLVFTEWGGWYIHNNPNLIKWFKKTIARRAHGAESQPSFAGMCWWQWQDIYQFSRGLPGCEEGLLSDGLVDRNRERKPMYQVMSEFFDLIDAPCGPACRMDEVGAHARARDVTAQLVPLDLTPLKSSLPQQAAWTHALENIKKFARTPLRSGIRNTGPIISRDIERVADLPVLISAGPPIILAGACGKVEIPVDMNTSALHMFGHTTYFDGYPVRGASCERLGRYVLNYEDGTVQEIQLRNGIELASASMIAINSRINPLAVATDRVLVLTIDPDWEVYQVNHFVAYVDSRRRLVNIAFESLRAEYYPLLYGITVEKSQLFSQQSR